MITYNHEKYIREAIEGVLIQKTSFPIELIISDDCSTDRTRSIIEDYSKKFPDMINPDLPEKNRGVSMNFLHNMDLARGKYIAICEGDDYWIDPFKLQKQVDFLEKNPDYILSCHRYKIYDEDFDSWGKDYCWQLFQNNQEFLDFDRNFIHKHWITKSMTLVFRNELNTNETSVYKYFRDVHLNYLLLSKGKGRCFDFDGAVYRIHSGGVHSSADNLKRAKVGYLIYQELYSHNPSDRTLKKWYLYSIDSYINRLCLYNKSRIGLILSLYFKRLFLNPLSKLLYKCPVWWFTLNE